MPSAGARRRAGARAAQKPDRRPIVIGVLAAVALMALVGLVLVGTAPRTGNYACGAVVEAQSGATVEQPLEMGNMGNTHLPQGSRLTYGTCPPTSGVHYNVAGLAPARPGFYAPDAGIGPGNWVHNLEHGYVVALYRCDEEGCPSETELEAMRTFISRGPSTPAAQACGYQSKVLAARFDDMSTPFALLVWDRLLLLDAFDTDEALDFASRWIEKLGPEATTHC